MEKEGKKLENVQQKWAYLMAQVGYIKKDEKVEYGSTKYSATTEAKVLQKIRPLMIELGLIMVPTNGTISVHKNAKETPITTVSLDYIVTDVESGTVMKIYAAGQGSDSQDKGAGKAMTYAGKYALLKGLMIETGDDPDKISSAELDDKEFKDDDPDFTVAYQKTVTLLQDLFAKESITDDVFKEYQKGLDQILVDEDWTRLKAADKVFRSL